MNFGWNFILELPLLKFPWPLEGGWVVGGMADFMSGLLAYFFFFFPLFFF